MIYKDIAEKIIELRNADLELRQTLIVGRQMSDGYNLEMAKLHNSNAAILNGIIGLIGYPTVDKVGKDASEAAWLIIQHSIEQPDFMRKCIKLLAVAVKENKASKKNLAYLKDRVAVFEGNPQLYGTQFDWDENGELNPNFFDELVKVNKRRKSIGLHTLEEQIDLIRKRAKEENQSAPTNYVESKKEVERWKKKVGWIK